MWDETHVANLLTISSLVLSDDPFNQINKAPWLGLMIMGDLLFDEGLYMDAWVAASSGFAELNLLNTVQETTDATISNAQAGLMIAFLFEHELGHLLRVHDPKMFAELQREVRAAVSWYSQCLTQLTPDKQAALLKGRGFILDEVDQSQIDISRHQDLGGLQPELLEEASADLFATMGIYVTSKESLSVYTRAESLFALRMAMEIVRDIRKTTRFVAIETRALPEQSSAENMRSLLLRQKILSSVLDLDQSDEDIRSTVDTLTTRYDQLLEHKEIIFGKIAEDLVDYGLEEARRYRRKMEGVIKFFGADSKWPDRYMNSYLKLRGWKVGGGDPFETALDTLSASVSEIQSLFFKRLYERPDVTPLGGGKVKLSPKEKQ